MIFITVGTTRFPFLRMRDIVTHLTEQNKQNEKIVFQHGATPLVAHKQVKNFYALPYQKMKVYMSKARIIICHGGPATIYQALSYKKKPYVLPRNPRYREHVNDHQLRFADFLLFQKKIIILHDARDLQYTKNVNYNGSVGSNPNELILYLMHHEAT